MRSRLRVAVLAFAAISLLAPMWPAAAHDDHPGVYDPSPASSSKNLKMAASLPRTTVEPTYRNSDLAFWGNLAFAGHYQGFRILDVTHPESPVVLSDVACPGAQHDVGVWQNLLFLSVDSPRTGPGCDSTPTSPGVGFEGIRIFDVRDPRNPVFAGSVATDCGSHTHTVVPDAADPSRVLLYVSSYPASSLGDTPYGTTCRRHNPDGTRAHSKISVVSVPLADPASASVVSQPTFQLNDFRGGFGFQGCHDITVFLEINRAASACLSEGQIWDISDPLNPVTLARVHNPNVEIWHSASFSWDGKTVLFGDEAGGGADPFCRSTDPSTVGAIWIYDVASLDASDASTVQPALSHFKIPQTRGQGDARCTMHNFNVVPMKGRHVAVASAYSGGTTVFDFTNRARPVEVGHNDPHGANTWSSYWYNGFIYTNDSGRGVDVMLLSDSARSGAKRLPYLNPQTQESLIR